MYYSIFSDVATEFMVFKKYKTSILVIVFFKTRTHFPPWPGLYISQLTGDDIMTDSYSCTLNEFTNWKFVLKHAVYNIVAKKDYSYYFSRQIRFLTEQTAYEHIL
jgi:hypothetical protein